MADKLFPGSGVAAPPDPFIVAATGASMADIAADMAARAAAVAASPTPASTTTPPSPPRRFNLADARVDTSAVVVKAAEVVYSAIQLRKPGSGEFFRVHPGAEYQATVSYYEYKGDRSPVFYLVSPLIAPHMHRKAKVGSLRLAFGRQAGPFLTLVPLGTDSWSESAALAAAEAEIAWIAREPDAEGKGFVSYRAIGEHPDPKWPERDLEELIAEALPDDRYIASMDHPIVLDILGA